MTTSPKPIFRCLKNSATLKVAVFLFNAQFHHGVNHMLKLIGTRHLSGFVDLSNDDSVTEILLTVIGNHT